jgi:hypothetical protein
VGLIARALELQGVATTIASNNPGRTRITAPPRVSFTSLPRGATLGSPGDTAQQRRILEATLELLTRAAPLKPVYLDEKLENG